jgi:hypothetical protein
MATGLILRVVQIHRDDAVEFNDLLLREVVLGDGMSSVGAD